MKTLKNNPWEHILWSPSDGAGGPAGDGTDNSAASQEAPTQEEVAGADDQPADGNGFADISALLDMKDDVNEDTNNPKPGEGENQDNTATEGNEGQPKPGEPGAEGAPPVKEPEKPGGDLETTLRTLIDEVKSANKPAEAKDDKTPQYTPKYGNVNIPDQIVAAIEHEDPKVRRTGLNAMLGAAMTKVYDDVRAELKAELKSTFDQVPAVIQAREVQQTNLKKMHDEFYGEYPQFKTPQGTRLAAMVGMSLGQELASKGEFKGWTPQFRKQLGERLVELTGLKAPAKPTPTNGQGNNGQRKPAGQPKPQFTAGNGARSGTQKSLADEISETIN